VFINQKASMKYISIENWSLDVYNLNTKKAHLQEEASIEWIGGNMGSCVSMLYPCSVLIGDRSKAKVTSLAWAKSGQIIDG